MRTKECSCSSGVLLWSIGPLRLFDQWESRLELIWFILPSTHSSVSSKAAELNPDGYHYSRLISYSSCKQISWRWSNSISYVSSLDESWPPDRKGYDSLRLVEVERIQGIRLSGPWSSDPEGKWYPKPGRPIPRGVFIPKELWSSGFHLTSTRIGIGMNWIENRVKELPFFAYPT